MTIWRVLMLAGLALAALCVFAGATKPKWREPAHLVTVPNPKHGEISLWRVDGLAIYIEGGKPDRVFVEQE